MNKKRYTFTRENYWLSLKAAYLNGWYAHKEYPNQSRADGYADAVLDALDHRRTAEQEATPGA